MIDSKQLMELSGISRATLNNYIAMKILPAPTVKITGDNGRSVRIGYFPDAAVKIIDRVQLMKKSGFSMNEIAEILKAENDAEETNQDQEVNDNIETEDKVMVALPREIKESEVNFPAKLELDIDNISGPAYMVNRNFELIWWNYQAMAEILNLDGEIPPDIHSRNLLTILTENARKKHSVLFKNHFQEMLAPHITVAKKVMSKKALMSFYSDLDKDEHELLDSLFDEAMDINHEAIIHFPSYLPDKNNQANSADLFVSFFSEGILFTYSQTKSDNNYLVGLLSQRNHVIGQILRKRKPFLSDVAILVADLQNAKDLYSQLPAEKYFELVNNIWQESEPVFKKYNGAFGKHPAEGIVFYFFPQPDSDYKLNAIMCALELKEVMRRLSHKWQSRKSWYQDIYINTVITEGREWFGAFHSGSHLEFSALGEKTDHANRINEFAHNGQIFITKDITNRLGTKVMEKLDYGITHRTVDGQGIFVSDTFSTIPYIYRRPNLEYRDFQNLENISFTEVRGYDPL